MPLLEVRALRKWFGGFAAIDRLDLDVAEGSIHAVIGPNGAGKTTFFNVVTGVLSPTHGRVVFQGTDISGRRPDVITRLGLARTFQNLRVFKEMTAGENVMVGSHCRTTGGFLHAIVRVPGRETARERTTRERAERLLDLVGLGGKRDVFAEELSLVEQRRLELARALASEPRLLLLDEPAAGMTPPEIEDLNRLIQKIAAGGVTILLTEHHMRLVMQVSHVVTVLNYGKKIAEGAPVDVRHHPAVLEAYLGPDA